MTSSWRAVAAALLPLAAGLVLGGCGGSPSAAPEPPPASSTPTPVVVRPTSPASSDPPGSPGSPAYDRAGLPRLFPAVAQGRPPGPHHAGDPEITGRGGPDGVKAGQEHLVVSVDGATLSAPIPAGWGATVSTTPVRVGGGTAYLVSQEGGDSDTWTVYVLHDGALVAATRPEHSAFGGGFTSSGDDVVLSWQTRGGRGLYTRVGLGGPHRNEVYSWHLRGTRLVPTDLGVVCLDPSRPNLWGRC